MAESSKGKIVAGLSDALGFAKGMDEGQTVRIYSASEFFFQGIRFNPGTYKITKMSEAEANETGADW